MATEDPYTQALNDFADYLDDNVGHRPVWSRSLESSSYVLGCRDPSCRVPLARLSERLVGHTIIVRDSIDSLAKRKMAEWFAWHARSGVRRWYRLNPLEDGDG